MTYSPSEKHSRDSAVDRSGDAATKQRGKIRQNDGFFSVADANAVRHLYAVVSPRQGSTYKAQLISSVEQTANIFAEHGGTITHQSVFLRGLDQAEHVDRLLRDLHGEGKMPATSYINQRPCDERNLVTVEATGVAGAVAVDYHGPHVTTVRYDGMTWVQTAPCVAKTRWSTANVYNRTLYAMWQTKSLLESVGANMNQVVRTWFYIGSIVADDSGVGPGIQRYKELNRARTKFFQHVDFLADRVPRSVKHTVYPASTGIGMAGEDVSLSALALMTDRSDVMAVPLENPRQVAAFNYGQHYSPESPKFSRAMMVTCGDQATTYISGTASITASETQHLGDAAKQTEETLENILTLIGEENVARHGLPGLGTDLGGLGTVRAYVKRREDYPAVRSICEKRLCEIPVVYSIGDVCRDDLLVELEGIAHSKKNASRGERHATLP